MALARAMLQLGRFYGSFYYVSRILGGEKFKDFHLKLRGLITSHFFYRTQLNLINFYSGV